MCQDCTTQWTVFATLSNIAIKLIRAAITKRVQANLKLHQMPFEWPKNQ